MVEKYYMLRPFLDVEDPNLNDLLWLSQIVIELERELMLSQEWVLTPEMDIVLNGRTNEDYQEGAGLAEIEFGLKLGYEHNRNRKFQPFLGLSSTTYFGRSKDFQKAEGHSSSEVNFKIGLHAWF